MKVQVKEVVLKQEQDVAGAWVWNATKRADLDRGEVSVVAEDVSFSEVVHGLEARGWVVNCVGFGSGRRVVVRPGMQAVRLVMEV